MKDKQIENINRGSTEYRIHVTGKIADAPETFVQTFKTRIRPASMEEVRRMAEDFVTIDKLAVEEVTTMTKHRIIHLE